MKINTINATTIATTNAIKALGTKIVAVSSSVSSFTSSMFCWRSGFVRGNRVVVERSLVVFHQLGLISHCLLAGLKPVVKHAMVADQPCCAYRMTQTCQPRTA